MGYVCVIQIANYLQVNLLADISVLAYEYRNVHKRVHGKREA